jgi:hypothetical protein
MHIGREKVKGVNTKCVTTDENNQLYCIRAGLQLFVAHLNKPRL